MAISVRGTITAGAASTTGATLTVPLTGWTVANPQSGDLVIIVGYERGTGTGTWSQTGGATLTFHSTLDHNANSPGVQSFAAYRKFDGTEGTTSITLSCAITGNRNECVAIALTPDAG